MGSQMRDPDPQPGADAFIDIRHREVHQNRYDEYAGRDGVPNVPYDWRAGTLEEEAYNGGWTRNNRPTGPDPINLVTVGMRGEPGWDDDANPATDGVGFAPNDRNADKGDTAQDISDSD